MCNQTYTRKDHKLVKVLSIETKIKLDSNFVNFICIDRNFSSV